MIQNEGKLIQNRRKSIQNEGKLIQNGRKLIQNEGKLIQNGRKSIGIRRKSRNNVGKLYHDESNSIQFVQVLKRISNTKEEYGNV
ncbi:hypothetical protein [Marinifilum fragile]|uniref:hypothetical protein n=1 Tax=Marinifilum fragile TaxID=570161 RepID=UPI002AA5F528|nr:hypothetical protein [Marinifilum fragile]